MGLRDFSLISFVVLAVVTGLAHGGRFRIIAGRKATTLEFPYQISLESYGYQWCGGSILNKRFIVTAAHCIKSYEKYRDIPETEMVVRVGHDLNVEGGTVYKIKKVIAHEKYVDDATIDQHDIGLVELEKPLEYSDRVKPIEMVKKPPKDGDMSWVTGYGRQEKRSGTNQLMAVNLPVISLKRCQKMIHGVADDMICAGHKKGNRDACGGDSGGPLAVDGKLAGVVAWGFGCGREGVPGVYTNVAMYRDWVIEKMGGDLEKREAKLPESGA